MPKIADPTNLPDIVTEKPRSSKIPVLVVGGDAVLRYNHASDEKKSAEQVMNELRPELVEAGIKFLFHKNAEATSEKERVKSVKLQTDDAEPEICMLSLSDKVKKMDAKAVEAALKALKVDPNACVEYAVVAVFDTSIFYDKEGKWVPSRYDKVQRAMTAVASELKTTSPLTCGKVLQAKPSFFLNRYSDFTLKQNLAIQDVVPCTVTLEPVRAKE